MMRDRAVHYGVKKLIAINSGKYEYADIDLTAPVHLSAPNNQGKSTLVNALQFLYVDELRYMGFGSRNLDDTRRHYFGENPSHLIFECLTPLGPKCMLVAGQGPLNNCRFLRFVFDGPFSLDDFRDEEMRLLTLDQMRSRLAGRGLSEIRPGNLWEVLGDPRTTNDSGSFPQLNILPVRTKEEYRSFRAVFIRLLSLSNVSAKELRELIITCHAREVSCRRVDVAAEHRDDFQRSEQAEHGLQFTLAVQDQVEKGRTIREDMEGTAQNLRADSPIVAEEVGGMFAAIDHFHRRLDEDRGQVGVRSKKLNDEIRERERVVGGLAEQRKTRQAELDQLDQLHEKWASSTDLMIESMRDNLSALTDQMSRLRDDIERAGRLDRDAMRRRVDALERDQTAKQRVLNNWDTRAVNALRAMGIANADVEIVFRLLNARLLDLAIGDEIVIHDQDVLKKELETIRESIAHGRYTDSAVTISLGTIDGPPLEEHRTRDDVRNDVRVVETQLARAREQLHVAEDQVRAEETLTTKQKEQTNLSNRLQEYDEYRLRWIDRAQLETSVQDLVSRVEGEQEHIGGLSDELTAQTTRVIELEDMRGTCERVRSDISAKAEAYRSEEQETRIRALLQAHTDPSDASDESLSWDEINARAQVVGQRLGQMIESIKSLARKRRQVEEVQKKIRDASRSFGGQTVYFSDEDADWDRLIQMVESLGEQKEAVEQSWSSLFTRVAAKLSDIHHGVSEIRTAINRINRGLADYRVSNLRSVKLEVVLVNQTYSMIETLTNEGGIFQDHEKIERAKDQLRRWIKDGRVIELDELFELHIHVHDIDRDRPTQAKSLDEIGSSGTGMTAKAMVFIQLVRAIITEERYRLHFFLDETGQLDDRNLAATTKMAVDKGVMPITADPDVRIEPLAHPIVTVYSLGQNAEGKFVIDSRRTCLCRRIEVEAGVEETA